MPRTPLWRNVLRFAGPVVLAVGVVVFAVVQFTGDSTTDKPLPPAPVEQVASAADQKALTPEIERVADTFIRTAVARKNVGASWEVTDPDFPGKSDFTKASWAKGDIPVVPAGYPFEPDEVKYSVDSVYPGIVVLDVILIPTTNKARAQRFQLSVKRHGEGASERWLVDYWMTRYVPGVLANPE